MSEFSELKTKFLNVTRRILEHDLSRNPNTILSQETDLFKSYNDIIALSLECFPLITQKNQIDCRTQLYLLRDKLKLCFSKLGLAIQLDPEVLTYVKRDDILQRTKYNENYELIEQHSSEQVPEEGTSSTNNFTSDQLNKFTQQASDTLDDLEQ